MTSVSSTNNAALLILQQAGPVTRPGSVESDIVKIANGTPIVSSEPSKASAQAAAAAGKFALDTAPEVGAADGDYQVSSDDHGHSKRMAAASKSEPIEWTQEELNVMMDAFDALAVKHGRDPLHQSIRSSILRTGGW